MLWPCLGRHRGVESNLLYSGSLGSPKGVVGYLVGSRPHSSNWLPLPLTHPNLCILANILSSYQSLPAAAFFFYLSAGPQTPLFPHPPTHYRAVETFEYSWKVFLEVGSWVGGAMGSRKQQKQQHQRWPHDPGTGRCKRMGCRSETFPTQVASIPSRFCTPRPFLCSIGKPAFSLPRCPVSALSLVNGLQVPQELSGVDSCGSGTESLLESACKSWPRPASRATPLEHELTYLL